jgi:hypothetical protein
MAVEAEDTAASSTSREHARRHPWWGFLIYLLSVFLAFPMVLIAAVLWAVEKQYTIVWKVATIISGVVLALGTAVAILGFLSFADTVNSLSGSGAQSDGATELEQVSGGAPDSAHADGLDRVDQAASCETETAGRAVREILQSVYSYDHRNLDVWVIGSRENLTGEALAEFERTYVDLRPTLQSSEVTAEVSVEATGLKTGTACPTPTFIVVAETTYTNTSSREGRTNQLVLEATLTLLDGDYKISELRHL